MEDMGGYYSGLKMMACLGAAIGLCHLYHLMIVRPGEWKSEGWIAGILVFVWLVMR